MREDFLHYLWRFQKFESASLKTTNGDSVLVFDPGKYLQVNGPDFFNARLSIAGQHWAGNVEIHIRSSDWYLHHHETDPAYENVILHVVWDHDMPVYRQKNVEIPVIEIRRYASSVLLGSYQQLMAQKSWINCERQIGEVDPFVILNWQERMFFERLQQKSLEIDKWLGHTTGDWEAVLFRSLMKSFGLNSNGQPFLSSALSIPFEAVRRENDVVSLESLLMGAAGLLKDEPVDAYNLQLQSRWVELSQKYSVSEQSGEPVQFFRHRPDNFPTIRLAQLAALYSHSTSIFYKLTAAVGVEQIRQIFAFEVSDYWQTHHNFGKESSRKRKSPATSFINLIVLNAILPVKFSFASSRGLDETQSLIDLALEIPAEDNAVIDRFRNLGIKCSSAFESQALLELKRSYCASNRCLECSFGNELLKPRTLNIL